jgi:hypothetical protein
MQAVFSMPVEGVDLSPLQPFLSRMWSTSGGFPAGALQDMERGVMLAAEYLITSSGSSGGAPDLDLHLPQQLTGVMGIYLFPLPFLFILELCGIRPPHHILWLLRTSA